ncbi:tRNA uridine-5-carboxymethylaminomethyl(34) synthesis enzyme MnmG [candidate division KSB1 bacterium]|nr:MAG: tRNA uridine-5-carboxymethylaminomethyl(34) synthesis enzyme MnmG [candidate division KSB1 bacterium]
MDKEYDVIVIGAGHAGCEAALAAARMGGKVLLITMNLFTIAQMSCNPAIGGLAKGHLVREIDALGGEMAKVSDKAGIQFRMLNKSKGPAVWSPRAQEDRLLYSKIMRKAIEETENIDLKEGMVREIIANKEKVYGVKTLTGTIFKGKTVIVSGGTFLNGLIHIGLKNFRAGRAGEFAATGLTESLEKSGIKSKRFKTGTPPRIDGKTVDWERCEVQPGDENPQPFSFQTEKIEREQVPCYLTYTNPETHKILESGFDRSPLFTGVITGTGPRYCPSVELKIYRFSDKNRHQIFLEPEGLDTCEYYVNGFSTSLPEDIQLKGLRSIRGLEHVEITRFGYAIEYDYFPPEQIKMNLESRKIENLFFAGQVNGTSGYEEAAAQGIMAGINAILKIRNEEPFILKRSESYIGVLIDDLVNKGTEEPYRLFTSRAEFRLLLRQDNADERLMPYGYKLGLIDENVYSKMVKKRKLREDIIKLLKKKRVKPEDINFLLERRGTTPISNTENLYNILKRPQISYNNIKELDIFTDREKEFITSAKPFDFQIEMEVKYEGYIKKQIDLIEKSMKFENQRIPENINYMKIESISKEAREKLNKLRPVSVAQASRISGVSPADITALLIHIKRIEKF